MQFSSYFHHHVDAGALHVAHFLLFTSKRALPLANKARLVTLIPLAQSAYHFWPLISILHTSLTSPAPLGASPSQ